MLESIIRSRRAYRALEPRIISQEEIEKIAELVSLAPSCNNNQPWRFIFVQDSRKLQELTACLSRGNQWAKNASLIVAVFSKADLDCQIQNRDPYFTFDTGMATAYLILLLTEIGLVAHPIAGFNLEDSKKVLQIPTNMSLITLIIVGKHTQDIPELLSEKQRISEINQPKRNPLSEFTYFDVYSE
jgi:nitroreductase